jgi:hypothetical protein
MLGLRGQLQDWFQRISDHATAYSDRLSEFFTNASNGIDQTFGPAMRALFKPANDLFLAIPPDVAPLVARESAVTLFLAAAFWVCFLRPEYVNLDAPSERFWRDLRLWTIFSMLPHVIIYRFL